jgi:ribosomal silencing factor RsfS
MDSHQYGSHHHESLVILSIGMISVHVFLKDQRRCQLGR